MTLDRRDTTGNYTRENCRWATLATQQHNRRDNVWLEHQGVRLCLSDMALKHGISKGALWWRINHGWSVAMALETPTKGR